MLMGWKATRTRETMRADHWRWQRRQHKRVFRLGNISRAERIRANEIAADATFNFK
jgi:hypothetical protein